MEQKNINMGEFKTEMERISYAMGMNMGEYMAHLPLPVDPSMVLRGIAELLAGNPKLGREDYQACMQQMQQMLQKAGQEEAARLAKANAEAGEKFLAENAKVDGVVTLPSGLQYQVINAGSGAKPTADDKVRVHYTGTLLDGQVFDSSVQRGQPVEFGVTQVIPGWVEGLQLMPVGSKYKFFIPANLAYGERGAGQHIQPNATLVFEVELLDIVK